VRPSRKRTRRLRGGGGHNIYIFYHIYCDKTTLDIVRDQVTKMIWSGLYAKVKQIYCFLAGAKTEVSQIEAYIKTLPEKFNIHKKGIDDNSYERLTLNSIKDLVTDTDKFLYLHTKGVTRTHEKGAAAECVTLWRNYMEYYMIALHKNCLEKLEDHDIVGSLYRDQNIGPHFSGNFWWSTGKYFRRLMNTENIGSNYYAPEAYIFKGGPNEFHIDGKRIPNTVCLYSTPLFPRLYVDKHPV
jgi:hypothetical protein